MYWPAMLYIYRSGYHGDEIYAKVDDMTYYPVNSMLVSMPTATNTTVGSSSSQFHLPNNLNNLSSSSSSSGGPPPAPPPPPPPPGHLEVQVVTPAPCYRTPRPWVFITRSRQTFTILPRPCTDLRRFTFRHTLTRRTACWRITLMMMMMIIIILQILVC